MKTLLLLLSILSLSLSLIAQGGKVIDDLSMKSTILNMDRKYAIYLPPDYETSQRSYPILYLLHGSGDDQTGWVQFGEVKHIADKAIEEGVAASMIIVMPDANTGYKGYFNSINGDWRYEDFFFEEFVPFVEKKFRIKPEKRFRAIAGLSMGGGGTYIYALHHPEMFSSACPLSASARPVTKDDSKKFIKKWGRAENVTDSIAEDYLHKYSALHLIKNMPEDQYKEIRWYIDCGDDDFLYEGNSLVHIAMRKKGIPHEFRIRDGGHNWTYWRTALPTVLEFVSMSFHQH